MARTPVTRARLEQFLQRLGRDFHGTGRLYLAGGAQMVLAGFRTQTQEIDYAVVLDTGSDQDFTASLRRLIRSMDINVEPAGPGDFIPLPRGWEDRGAFIGRYEGLDVFAFDPLSTALAKIERGTAQDIADVSALLGAGLLALSQLEAAFEEIVPRLEQESVRVDEDDFRRKVEAFVRLAQNPSGSTSS